MKRQLLLIATKYLWTSPVSKKDTVIVATNVHEKDFPQKLKDIPKDINPYLEKPDYMGDSEFRINKKSNDKLAKYAKRQIFKQYKRIRNMSYRYI